jgi:hypothetical protein
MENIIYKVVAKGINDSILYKSVFARLLNESLITYYTKDRIVKPTIGKLYAFSDLASAGHYRSKVFSTGLEIWKASTSHYIIPEYNCSCGLDIEFGRPIGVVEGFWDYLLTNEKIEDDFITLNEKVFWLADYWRGTVLCDDIKLIEQVFGE